MLKMCSGHLPSCNPGEACSSELCGFLSCTWLSSHPGATDTSLLKSRTVGSFHRVCIQAPSLFIFCVIL